MTVHRFPLQASVSSCTSLVAETGQSPLQPPASPLSPQALPDLSRAAPRLSLRANFSWTLAGNLVYVCCQWGVLVVLAKLGSKTAVGLFGLGLAITAPIMLLANLELRAVQATDAARHYDFRDYFALRLLTTLAALLVITAAVFCCGYDRATVAVILAIGAAKAVEAISDVISGLLQQHERLDRIAQIQMITGTSTLVAVAAVMFLTRDVAWGMGAMFLVWLGRLFVLDLPSARWVLGAEALKPLLPRWDWQLLGRLARQTLPLGLAATVISLNENVPRYFIEHYLGAAELGAFVAIVSLARAGYTALSALEQSALPRLAAYYAQRNVPAFRQVLLQFVAVGTVIFVAATGVSVWFGREILTLVYTAEYAQYTDLLVWGMVATTIAFLGHLHPALVAMRRFKTFLGVWSISLAVLAVLAAILVPAFGLIGAAAALLLANTVRLATAVGSVWYYTRDNFRNARRPCLAEVPA